MKAIIILLMAFSGLGLGTPALETESGDNIQKREPKFQPFANPGSGLKLPTGGDLPSTPCGIGSDSCGSDGTTGCGPLVKLLPCPTKCCPGLVCEGGFFSAGTCKRP